MILYEAGCTMMKQVCSVLRFCAVSNTRNLHQQSKIPQGLVYVSTSNDVFANLAFEDWVHDNMCLTHTNVLFLWRNNPAVVIGRHQNPWSECNINKLILSNIQLARRRSGGGTVYHDLGNLNCTFFTDRSQYNRRHNLEMMVAALKGSWPNIHVSISNRDDILLENFYKISGTSAKLGQSVAYHHFTLMLSVKLARLKDALHVDMTGLDSKATESIRSTVRNLCDVDTSINHREVISALAKEYYSVHKPQEQSKLYYVDPTDEKSWPGIEDMKEKLKSWKWVFGKSPRFSVERCEGEVSVVIHTYQGRIERIDINTPPDAVDANDTEELVTILTGIRFWSSDILEALNSFLNTRTFTRENQETWKTIEHLIMSTAI
ncbi:lipoyl amidotransferase LIPT1, mitochondrial-like [Antedon mediterranea]|uniref:lipoyl amidotransferase LIPT1, mitochondrial-like n=1 Tax=Antedon mediterranea TaxID=105859 RepID=UPI003AF410F9